MKKQRLLLDRAAYLDWRFRDDPDDYESAVDLIIDSLSNQDEATISLNDLVKESDMIPERCVLNFKELSKEFIDEWCEIDEDEELIEIMAPDDTYYVEWK